MLLYKKRAEQEVLPAVGKSPHAFQLIIIFETKFGCYIFVSPIQPCLLQSLRYSFILAKCLGKLPYFAITNPKVYTKQQTAIRLFNVKNKTNFNFKMFYFTNVKNIALGIFYVYILATN